MIAKYSLQIMLVWIVSTFCYLPMYFERIKGKIRPCSNRITTFSSTEECVI